MKALRDRLLELLVTSGGLGLAPWAPGTFGTLAGLALAAFLGATFPASYLPGVLALAALSTLGSVAAGPWAERFYGRKDPSPFVLDEVAGYLVAAAWTEFPGWSHLVAAFLFFRLTDVWKPFPARTLQKLPHGWGIVMDDLAAGVWAWLMVVGLRTAFPGAIGA